MAELYVQCLCELHTGPLRWNNHGDELTRSSAALVILLADVLANGQCLFVAYIAALVYGQSIESRAFERAAQFTPNALFVISPWARSVHALEWHLEKAIARVLHRALKKIWTFVTLMELRLCVAITCHTPLTLGGPDDRRTMNEWQDYVEMI
jgi:hypothetical protein